MIEIAGIEIESIEDLWRNDRVREELIAKAWLTEIEKLTAIEDVSIGKPFPPRSGGIDGISTDFQKGKCHTAAADKWFKFTIYKDRATAKSM